MKWDFFVEGPGILRGHTLFWVSEIVSSSSSQINLKTSWVELKRSRAPGHLSSV